MTSAITSVCPHLTVHTGGLAAWQTEYTLNNPSDSVFLRQWSRENIHNFLGFSG